MAVRFLLLIGALAALTLASPAEAGSPGDPPPRPTTSGPTTDREIEACIASAASVYRLPPAVLVILLRVEGGTPGSISRNANRTVDIGPMQVNQIWLSKIAQHWQATIAEAFVALRDNFCANVEGGSWILRQTIDQGHGDLWTGIALYHSHRPVDQTAYLRHVLDQIATLERRVQAPALAMGHPE